MLLKHHSLWWFWPETQINFGLGLMRLSYVWVNGIFDSIFHIQLVTVTRDLDRLCELGLASTLS